MIRQEDCPEMEELWSNRAWKSISIHGDKFRIGWDEEQFSDFIPLSYIEGTTFYDALKKHFPEEFI